MTYSICFMGFGGVQKNKNWNFYNFLSRSGIISRMVYMDSSFFIFCIRNAIGGACDESMVICHFMIHGPPVTHTKWGSDQMIKSEMWRLCASVNSNLKYKCTSIIKTKKRKKFRIRLILPDLTAIGLILSHASHCSNTRQTAQ